MSNVQPVPEARSDPGAAFASAPFDAVLAADVQRLLVRLDPAQRLWLSGYLAGSAALASPAAEPAPQAAVTILYGSQSGNCELLAKRLGEALAARGITHATLDMLDCRKHHLLEARHLLVVVSTYGEGEPPERAKPLHELLHGRKAPRLEHLRYAVLALGDSSYEHFCETGRQFDARLEALGARRLCERTECDVDFDAPAANWIEAVVGRLATEGPPSGMPPRLAAVRPTASLFTAYTRKNPFAAPVLANQRLTARHSTKDVRHIELSIEGAGLHYEPGDSLGVVPRNHEDEVAALLAALPFAPEAPVALGGRETALREALRSHCDIGLLTRPLLERYVAHVAAPALRELLAPERADDLARFLRGRHLIDLVIEHPPRGLEPGAFAQLLRPLAPRLYSIASSQRVTPDEVHLTVSVVAYESWGRARRGVVSGALAALTGESDVALVYPQRNPAFRLPSAPHVPIIMIGPGTGVAPFRAFLAEREALGATGRNWLFFGDRNFRSDFLYHSEWLDLRRRGVLHRLDVAFSRDGPEKVYVQQRMREHGRELYDWLEQGAHLYLCGDAQHMAPDVERALHEIIARHGGRGGEHAEEYVLELQRARRYQKDVY